MTLSAVVHSSDAYNTNKSSTSQLIATDGVCYNTYRTVLVCVCCGGLTVLLSSQLVCLKLRIFAVVAVVVESTYSTADRTIDWQAGTSSSSCHYARRPSFQRRTEPRGGVRASIRLSPVSRSVRAAERAAVLVR